MDEVQRRGFSISSIGAAASRTKVRKKIRLKPVKSVQTTVELRIKDLKAETSALIDSGATENFVHQRLVTKLKIPRRRLVKPRTARNVDGTINKAGKILHTVHLTIQHRGIRRDLPFYVTELGQDNMILGYPFLKLAQPEIDWDNGTMKGKVTATTENPLERPPVHLKKTTTSTQLAITEANKKEEKPWHQIVPKEYHSFRKVFNEEASKRIPEPKPWDHAIDLKPNAPASFDCKIYPLSPREQQAMEEFLDKHLQKGYITPSKSPYASPFFFVKKKDGKLRPVQDY